jgi:hypothetical protein
LEESPYEFLGEKTVKVLDELTRVFHMALHFIHEEVSHSQRRVLEALAGHLGGKVVLQPTRRGW